jgi:hypothetical protein
VSYDLGALDGALQALDELLDGQGLIAERVQAAIIEGRAGTGKSQLLAHVAEVAAAEKTPVLLILGQHLRNSPLWPQILQRLGIANLSQEGLLAALDAAAEASRVRGLILIDAVNEGAGARLWRKEVSSFLEEIRPYSNLACVLSCRSEYVEYVLPQGVLKALPRIEVRGFETPAEQENAARVYLDRRGISRPATPWLAPEFTNPLFLRSCCNALEREGKTEFPRGLVGTKTIFAFFLESVGRHLDAGRDGTDDLVAPTKETLVKLAAKMAEERNDSLPRAAAEAIARKCFEPFPPPEGMTWLDVLQRNGLVRFDPDPTVNAVDPLQEPRDVVRFSFQRFQDHLIAESLLATIGDAKAAFGHGGPLSFLHDGENLKQEHQGIIEALSVQISEKFQVELVDALSGESKDWWRYWEIRDAFAESVRWRHFSAFSDRTLELFNRLTLRDPYRRSLLIELSASIDHPWNAELIHANLLRKRMPEHDSLWTQQMASAVQNPSHPIYRVIDWCLNGQSQRVERETQRLCALVLTWCFALPNRPIRDCATKAFTQILLLRKDIFSDRAGC